jgi:hypothetical protein
MKLGPDDHVMDTRSASMMDGNPARFGAPAQASMDKLMKLMTECGMETPDLGGTVVTADQHIRMGCLEIVSSTFNAILISGGQRPAVEEFQSAVDDTITFVTIGRWPATNK